MQNLETVVYDKNWHDHTSLIMINNPKELNSYLLSTLREMIHYFEDSMWDDNIQFIVLTGAGERAFCTGGNVKEYAEIYNKKPSDFWKWGEVYGRVFHMIRHCGKPVIARVNGVTAGGGFEFVAACDLAIASENVKFLSPGPRVGMTSIGGLSQWLPLHMGIKKAAEIVMLSREISAKQACELGVVNEVVPLDKLDETVKKYITDMMNLSPSSLHYFKVHINFWRDLVWDLTWEHAKEWFSLHIGSVEPSEGLWAFKEKRERNYKGLRNSFAKGMDPQFPFGPYLAECKKCGTKYIPLDSKFCLICGNKI
ncbi:MAG: enoyl-CoA hydratase/isomerase family protein [Acidobacteriota bacterium]